LWSDFGLVFKQLYSETTVELSFFLNIVSIRMLVKGIILLWSNSILLLHVGLFSVLLTVVVSAKEEYKPSISNQTLERLNCKWESLINSNRTVEIITKLVEDNLNKTAFQTDEHTIRSNDSNNINRNYRSNWSSSLPCETRVSLRSIITIKLDEFFVGNEDEGNGQYYQLGNGSFLETEFCIEKLVVLNKCKCP